MRDDPSVASLCRFVLVGLTGEYPNVEKAAKDVAAGSAFPEKFMFFDKKEHDQAVQILTSADVLVSVADKESFGMALLEGMTAGLPAIVQKVDGVPEVVYEGAIDVDPKDIDSFAGAMHRMLDPAVRSAQGARAAQRSAFFDKGAFYTKHALALREVIESSGFARLGPGLDSNLQRY
jgi:glycosyltransferase involved in cell wall biosynthesis